MTNHSREGEFCCCLSWVTVMKAGCAEKDETPNQL